MVFDGDHVAEFSEKPQTSEGWINGAFFVLEPQVLDYVEGDMTQWEREPMERLAADGQLMAYRHADFWQCMDTLRDKRLLEDLWSSGSAPWAVWEKEPPRPIASLHSSNGRPGKMPSPAEAETAHYSVEQGTGRNKAHASLAHGS
jgi:NDP-sugar pyrophosphorylase family protein